MIHKKTRLLCLLCISIFYIKTVIALDLETNKQYQSISSIQNAIYTFIEHHIDTTQDYDISIHRLNSRLKLAQCTSPLKIKINNNTIKAGILSVKISCDGAQKWSLNTSAKLILYKNVLTLTQNLERDTLILKEHVKTRKYPVSKLHHGYFTHYKQIKNKLTRRRLRTGAILHPSHIKTPLLVEKGDQVNIVAHHSNFKIQMPGLALHSGKLGDQISVKNIKSKKIIKGTITQTKTVTVY